MKKMMLISAGLFALGTLIISIGFLLFGPSDGLGVPKAPWLRLLANPAIWVGTEVFLRFHCPIWICQAAGITAMALIWAFIGSMAGLVYSKVRRPVDIPSKPR